MRLHLSSNLLLRLMAHHYIDPAKRISAAALSRPPRERLKIMPAFPASAACFPFDGPARGQ